MAKPLTQTISLVDNMTPTLNKIQRENENMLKTYDKLDGQINKVVSTLDKLKNTGQSTSPMYRQLSNELYALTQTQEQVAQGNQKIIKSLQDTKNVMPSVITSLVGFTAVSAGVKGLMEMSDTAIATTARLDLVNDGLQTTAELEEKIYQAAQSVGVGYNTVADTVIKLGMQAGDAFNNSNDEILAFTDLLNKTFQVAGMNATAIESTMYNMTQSLSTGRLVGQDYRILKQNAPQMIAYLREFYGVSAAEMDEMVSKGQVSAQALKNAMFKASEDINEKYSKMPISFEAAWTKFMNTMQRMMTPLAKALSVVADGMDKFFTFLSKHQYIIYIVAGALGIVVTGILAYNTYTAISTVLTNLLSTAMGKLALKMILIVAIIAAVAIALLYLWNTNDDAAYAMLWTWEMVQIGFETVILGLKTAWYGFVSVVYAVASVVLGVVQMIVNGVISGINFIIKGLNLLPGVDIQLIKETTFADDFITKGGENVGKMGDELQDETAKLMDKTRTLNATREQRVQERQKVGIKEMTDGIGKATTDALSPLEDIIDTDSTGGKAVKTTTDDKLLSDDDIQLLLDLATRDYKLNYQQVTPNITLTFGDVMQTADVDDILDSITDKLEEIYDSDLEVAASVS